jgi:SAM-dependent methyltransferase
VRFGRLKRDWDYLGSTDPMWAVLTNPEKRGSGWDEEQFFRHGQREIATVLKHLDARGIELRRGRALDFGSGVGRLSQALADHFEHVVGVDIAASMVERATELNRHGDRCTYVVNTRPDLGRFPNGSFDFVYSNITLQHMPPRLMRRYLAEFVRVLAPGGVAVFEIVDPPPPLTRARRILGRTRAALLRRARIRMYWLSGRAVESVVQRHGGTVVDARRRRPSEWWTRVQYTVVTPGAPSA